MQIMLYESMNDALFVYPDVLFYLTAYSRATSHASIIISTVSKNPVPFLHEFAITSLSSG